MKIYEFTYRSESIMKTYLDLKTNAFEISSIEDVIYTKKKWT